MIDLFGKIRNKMSFRQFNDFMEQYAANAFEIGLREGEREGITFDEDELFDILCDVGVSPSKANKAIDRIFQKEGGT